MMMTTMMEEMTWDERQSFQSSHPERRVGYPEDLQEKEKAKAKETEKKKTTRSVASRYSSSFLLLSFISNLFYFSYPLLDYIHMGLRPPPSPCACHVSVCVKTVVYAHPIHPY